MPLPFVPAIRVGSTMTLLFSVLTAAYGKGTHHRLALDGVRRLEGPNAEAWQRLFYKHAEILVTGSKAPDDQFKDFQNHVLHPRDNFWGGAPDKARSWYVDLVEQLAKGDWPAAVWCAGVLSHYVTDPINPFHTAQSEAENAIHRAFEWSISTSYADLKKLVNADARREINVGEGGDWLEQLICQAASDANQHYEKLIAHYDIHRGVVDPPSGLDDIARKIIGDLIGQASAVFAVVLQRAIADSKTTPPEVSLTLEAMLATLKIPMVKVLKKLADKEERRLVERMYDELKETGTVEVNLPEDDRAVRDLHAKEVLGAQAKPDLSKRFPEKGRRKTAATEGELRERLKRVGGPGIPGAVRGAAPTATQSVQELPVDEPARPAPKAADQAQPAGPVGRFKGQPVPEVREAAAPVVPQAVKAETSVPVVIPAAFASSLQTRAPEPPPVAEAEKPLAVPLPDPSIRARPGTSAAEVPAEQPPATAVSLVAPEQAPPRPRLVQALATVQPQPAPAARAQVKRPLMKVNQPSEVRPTEAPAPQQLAARNSVPSATPLRAVQPSQSSAQSNANQSAPRLYLTPAQPIVDAPSIGPKMAERLIPLGINTVGDLLAADARSLAAKLAMSVVTPSTVADWQDQARLVCTVPGLRGTHAQLLVGAGFRSAEAIATAEPADLCSRVLMFATGKDGQRILRDGQPPDIERIKSWVDSARAVRAA